MTKRDHEARRDGSVSRRELLRFGAAGALGAASLATFARDAHAMRRRVPVSGPRLVVLNLKGGNDGLNTLVPVALQTYYDRRPGLAIAEESALSLDAGPWATTQYRLHPALTYLQTAYTNGDLALVNKVGYPDANGSHFESETIYSRARRDISAITGPASSGWLARLVDVLGASPTSAISVGTGSPEDFRGASSALLSLGGSLSSFEFEIDWNYSSTNDPHRKATVAAILDQFQGSGTAGSVRDAHRLGHELEESIRAADDGYVSPIVYPGGNTLASHLQTVAKLVQGGFDTKVFYVARGGYDTHGAQAGAQSSLHSQMSAALDAFAQDLELMGVWDETVILVLSEFGRRTFENGSGGTDHGSGGVMMVLGGAVTGGIYGPDLTEADLEPDNLEYAVDFRSVYAEIVGSHFGLDQAATALVLPEAQELETTLGFLA